MDKSEPNIKYSRKNYDSFIRKVIVGTTSYFYDTLTMPTMEGGSGSMKMVTVPIFYSSTFDYQQIVDLFMDTDKHCDSLSSKYEGNLKRIPSGIMTVENGSIDSSNSLSKYERGVYYEDAMSEYGVAELKKMNATARMVPLKFTIKVKFRANTDSERFILWESVIKTYFEYSRFHLSYDGFKGIPCDIVLKQGDPKFNNQFRVPSSAQEEYKDLEFSFELFTYMPVKDLITRRDNGNRIETFNLNLHEKIEPIGEEVVITDNAAITTYTLNTVIHPEVLPDA